MKLLRSTFWVAFFFTLVWSCLLASRQPAPFAALLHGDHLVSAELRVGESGCSRSGGEVLWRCQAEGILEASVAEVTGASGTLRWPSEDGVYVQRDTLVPVLAGRWLFLPVGPVAVSPQVEEPRVWAWRQLQPALRLPKIGLGVMAAVLLLAGLGRLQRTRGGDRMELDQHGSSLGCAVLLLGVGVPLLGFGAKAAVGWALGLIALGLLVQLRRVVVVDRRAATLSRAWQLLVLRRLGRPSPLGVLSSVAISRKAQAAEIFLVGSRGRQRIVAQATPAAAARQARELARFLGLPVGDGAEPMAKRDVERPIGALGASTSAVARTSRQSSPSDLAAGAAGRPEEPPTTPVTPTVADLPRVQVVGDGETRPAFAVAGCLLLIVVAAGISSFALAGGVRGVARRALAPAVASWPAAEWLQSGAVALLGEARGSTEELDALLGWIDRAAPGSPAWSRAISAACRVAGRDELRSAAPETALLALREELARQRRAYDREE